MNDDIGRLWRNRRVLVLGMARSGRGAARLLARHGATVRATDLRTADELELDSASFAREGITLRLGGHDAADLEGVELAVVSPGIPKTAPFLQEIRRRGIPLRSEMEVASSFAAAPIAAVTGTNGKSTTVTVLGELIGATGRPVEVAGNVGRALSDVVERVPAEGVLVVEVSSYQLEDIETFHPRVAAVLNVTPDHLDRYASFDDYMRTKMAIFANQNATDAAVLPAGDPLLEPEAGSLAARVLRFGFGPDITDGVAVDGEHLVRRASGAERAILPVAELSLPGPHNHANVAAALCLLDGLGGDLFDPRVIERLRTMRGLPHRLEPVGEVEGIAFFNDSKATNPESLEVALRSFPDGVVLLAGGKPKDSDYARLTPLIRRHTAAVVLIGEAEGMLEKAWADAGREILACGSNFEAAVRTAFERARAAGVPVLLSPGCASFDMFRDFEDRGERFRDLVRRWEAGS